MPQWLESLLDTKRGFFLITGSFGGSFVVGLVASLVLGLHDYAHANCPTKSSENGQEMHFLLPFFTARDD